MITAVRNAKVFTNGSLPNDDYHDQEKCPGISSSGLYTIYSESEAFYRYGEHEPTAALHFGTASHAAMLEPEVFDSMFVRGPSKDDYKPEDLLTSDTAVKSKLKAMGIPGYSTKSGKELWDMALKADPKLQIWSMIESLAIEMAADSKKTLVKGDDYDMIMQMRRVMFSDPEYAELFTGSFFETSIICDVQVDGFDGWIPVKIRPDIITADRMVPDYKTTRNVNAEDFGRTAFYGGYWLRQMFVVDVLTAVYGQSFKAALLAQDKRKPFIPRLYYFNSMTETIGREQYTGALVKYGEALRDDFWPARNEPTELFVPAFIAKMYE